MLASVISMGWPMGMLSVSRTHAWQQYMSGLSCHQDLGLSSLHGSFNIQRVSCRDDCFQKQSAPRSHFSAVLQPVYHNKHFMYRWKAHWHGSKQFFIGKHGHVNDVDEKHLNHLFPCYSSCHKLAHNPLDSPILALPSMSCVYA